MASRGRVERAMDHQNHEIRREHLVDSTCVGRTETVPTDATGGFASADAADL